MKNRLECMRFWGLEITMTEVIKQTSLCDLSYKKQSEKIRCDLQESF